MLEIKSLKVGYKERDVLEDISLTVAPGEILALVGPNGAGKSTLIRAVSGVIPPQSGEILIDGKDTLRLSAIEKARVMSVVPQARNLPDTFSVYHTVLLGRTPYLSWLGNPGKKDHKHVVHALEMIHAAELSDRIIGTLSGGEKQRVLLARSLAQNTPVMLLDEPTTHLDLQHQSNLLNLIRKLTQDRKLAVLMVIHDLNLAALYADRIALIADGKVFANGRPKYVLTHDNLTEVFKVPVNVSMHPEYHTPMIMPVGKHNGNGKQRAQKYELLPTHENLPTPIYLN